jgi:hypothetical protein
MKTLIVAAVLAAACVTPSLARPIPANNGLSPAFDDHGFFVDAVSDPHPATAEPQQLAGQPEMRMASAPADQEGRRDGAPPAPSGRPATPSLGDYRN